MKMESLLTVNYTKYAIHNSLNSQMHSEKAFIQEHLHGEKKKGNKKPQPTNQKTQKNMISLLLALARQNYINNSKAATLWPKDR